MKEKKGILDIAVIDNGHGMIPDMIRASVLWGGTHRHNDRRGFGRFGFGLPSAAVSITREYEVYSKIKNGSWHKVRISLDDIVAGKLTNDRGDVLAPDPTTTALPEFVLEYLDKHNIEITQGTVVILKNPDRLTSGFISPSHFHRKMAEHVGVIYRWILRNCKMYINGQEVSPVDPLFLESNALYFDVKNKLFAEAMEQKVIDFTNKKGELGKIRFRFSYMHPHFQNGPGEIILNSRFPIMKENNHSYFIVTRAGRQIDIIKKPDYPEDKDDATILTYDRNWAVELDFDPILDEEFGITTNKQQVTISERLWTKFASEGIPLMVKSLRKRLQQDKAAIKGDELKAMNAAATSENIMAETEKYVSVGPKNISPEKEEQAARKIKEDAQEKSKQTGKSTEEHERQFQEDAANSPYKVHFEGLEGAPFFRVDFYGPQRRLYINTKHRFFSDIYNSSITDSKFRSSLELLLFVIGNCELESDGEKEIFYKAERPEWSRRLEIALMLLDKVDSTVDAKSAKEEFQSA